MLLSNCEKMKRALSRACVFHDQSAKWLLPSLGFMVVNPALWKLLLGLPFKIILIPEREPSLVKNWWFFLHFLLLLHAVFLQGFTSLPKPYRWG